MKKLTLFLSFLFVISCTKDPIIYTLTTSANPSDGGTVSPSTQQYEEGKTATITATASSEYLFQSWSGVTGSTNSTSIVMNSDKSVTANFVKKKYALTTTVEGEGTVTEKVIKAGAATDYNSGTIVELTATPSTGWGFKEWQGDLTGTDNPKEITINKAKTVKAVFEAIPVPFYLDDNGVTIKAKDWVTVGITGELNGVTYTAVDNTALKEMVENDEDVNKVVTTLVTEMDYLFSGIYNENNGEITYKNFNQNIASWDVSNVTSMNSVFRYANSFNQDIGNWDVSNVIDMQRMFLRAHNFNQDIGDWDVSNVTDMSYMFYYNPSFNQDIGDWDVSNVTDMTAMFLKADNFNQDIGNWDVSNVIDMQRMFYNNPSFNQDIGSWDVSKVTDMSSMFGIWNRESSFNQDIGNWDVSNVKDMSAMFLHNSSFNQDIGNWDVSNVLQMHKMFENSIFNKDIGDWDVGNVIYMSEMFKDANQFNQDIGNWNVSNLVNENNSYNSGLFSMFENATNFNQDLTRWCVEPFTNEPNNFSLSSGLLSSNKPIWGTCPD